MKPLRMMLCLLVLWGLAGPAQAGFFEEWSVSAYGEQAFDLDAGGDLYGAGVVAGLAAPLQSWKGARLDFRLEAKAGGFWDRDSGAQLAVLPGLRLYFGENVRPYLEGGIGPSLDTLDIEELGTGFNFLSYGGVGVLIPLERGKSLVLGYRLQHLSNAGLDADNNSGVNSHQVQAGLVFPF
jgi:hypothetical protein